MSNNQDRYAFWVEWFDTGADLLRTYLFTFYIEDKTIELYDMKQKRIFLRRTILENVTTDLFFIGSIMNIFSRQMKIVGYADAYTTQKFETKKQKTFALIKPDAYQQIGKIITIIEQSGIIISKMKMTQFSYQQGYKFYEEHKQQPFFENLVKFITSDFILGMELVGDNVIEKWRNIIGQTDPQIAKKQLPNSIRAKFGKDIIQNSVHGSQSSQAAETECSFFFDSKIKTTAILNNCTCCVIKPHILTDRNAGNILDQILQEGFEISAIELFYLDKPSSQEFLEIYKNLIPEYNEIVDEMTLGPCIALEIRHIYFQKILDYQQILNKQLYQLRQENSVKAFRQICGPYDPDISKTIRKNTLRAKYGKSIAQNAVHCTDLEEDGRLECEQFFKFLQIN